MIDNSERINDKKALIEIYESIRKKLTVNQAFWWALAYTNAAVPLMPMFICNWKYVFQALLAFVFAFIALDRGKEKREIDAKLKNHRAMLLGMEKASGA